jgi:hypothetical protein
VDLSVQVSKWLIIEDCERSYRSSSIPISAICAAAVKQIAFDGFAEKEERSPDPKNSLYAGLLDIYGIYEIKNTYSFYLAWVISATALL